MPAVEVPLLAGSWTEASAMRYLPGFARQWAFAALDTGLSFPSAPGPGGTNLSVGGRCVLWVEVFVYT